MAIEAIERNLISVNNYAAAPSLIGSLAAMSTTDGVARQPAAIRTSGLSAALPMFKCCVYD